MAYIRHDWHCMNFMMKPAILLAATVTACGAANAATQTYVIDSERTIPWFEYRYFGYPDQRSRFDKTSGSITIDREAKKGSIKIRIDSGSINTGSSFLDRLIQSEELFNTARYPDILFTSDDLRFEGEKLIAINGNLTIKNITRPVVLKVTAFYCTSYAPTEKNTCGAVAVTTLKRSDFDVGKYAPVVSDEVNLNIVVEATSNAESKP